MGETSCDSGRAATRLGRGERSNRSRAPGSGLRRSASSPGLPGRVQAHSTTPAVRTAWRLPGTSPSFAAPWNLVAHWPGGGLALASGGGSVGRPRCARIFCTGGGWVRKAGSRRGPPQAGQRARSSRTRAGATRATGSTAGAAAASCAGRAVRAGGTAETPVLVVGSSRCSLAAAAVPPHRVLADAGTVRPLIPTVRARHARGSRQARPGSRAATRDHSGSRRPRSPPTRASGRPRKTRFRAVPRFDGIHSGARARAAPAANAHTRQEPASKPRRAIVRQRSC